MLVEVYAVEEVQEPGAVDGEAGLSAIEGSACAVGMPRACCVYHESV